VQDQFSIDITLHSTIREPERWFENQDKPVLLQADIQVLILINVPNKEEGMGHTVLVTKKLFELPKVQNPSLVANRKVEVLAVDKRVVIFSFIRGCLLVRYS
jgi:hypothetical protein